MNISKDNKQLENTRVKRRLHNYIYIFSTDQTFLQLNQLAMQGITYPQKFPGGLNTNCIALKDKSQHCLTTNQERSPEPLLPRFSRNLNFSRGINSDYLDFQEKSQYFWRVQERNSGQVLLASNQYFWRVQGRNSERSLSLIGNRLSGRWIRFSSDFRQIQYLKYAKEKTPLYFAR